MHGTIMWKPDESVPYMIHSKDHFLDNMVIIWPEVIQTTSGSEHNVLEEYFCYMTNREHIFRGNLIHSRFLKTTSIQTKIDFFQQDGIGSPAMLHIAPLTDEEFLSTQEYYKNSSTCLFAAERIWFRIISNALFFISNYKRFYLLKRRKNV